MEHQNYGQINLESYLASSSFDRIKGKFFIYDKLYTTDYELFKSLQLESGYGNASHLEKVNLLMEQGLIENAVITYDAYVNGEESEALGHLASMHSQYQELDRKLEINDTLENANKIRRFSFAISAMKERLYAEYIGKNLGIKISPVTSLNSYGDILKGPIKTEVVCILLDQFPMPDNSMPLVDIIQYKNDQANQLNYLKIKSWINKISHSGYSNDEIIDEVRWLSEEYKTAMKAAGIKMKNARWEFAIKVVPEICENLIKLNLSKLADPFFRLRAEKLTLLETERNATGNELAYIINQVKG